MEGHIVHRLYDGRGQQEPETHKPTAAGPHTRRTRARENEREPKSAWISGNRIIEHGTICLR